MTSPNTSATGGFLTPTSPLPAYDDALADQITATVAGITGLSPPFVRPRWQPIPPDQPDRATSWCAVGVISIEADTNPTLVHNGTGLGSSTGYRGEEIIVLASLYGPNSAGIASLLRDGFGIRQNQSAMLALGLAFVRTERITSVPELTNTEWINRVDVSFRVRRRVARTYAIENIVSVSGAFTSDSGGISGQPVETTPFHVG